MAIDLASIPYTFNQAQLNVIHHYIIHGSKIAAFRHGYDCSRRSQATTEKNTIAFFKNPHIQQLVAMIEAEALKVKNERIGKMVVDKAWVLERLALLANFNIKKFITTDDNGNAVYDFKDATDDDWYCISEYTVDEINRGSGENRYIVERVKIKAFDKIAALGMIGKHVDVRAFTESIELNAPRTITPTDAVSAAEQYQQLMGQPSASTVQT